MRLGPFAREEPTASECAVVQWHSARLGPRQAQTPSFEVMRTEKSLWRQKLAHYESHRRGEIGLAEAGGAVLAGAHM